MGAVQNDRALAAGLGNAEQVGFAAAFANHASRGIAQCNDRLEVSVAAR